MSAFFRDYKVDPEDSGQFVESSDMGEGDLASVSIKGGSLTFFDKPKENPFPHLRYFCRVGGGYRGFVKRKNAVNHERQPL